MLKRAMCRCGVSLSIVAALVFASSALQADVIVISITAEANGESASFTWVVPKNLDARNHMDWSIAGPLVLTGANGPILTIDNYGLGLDGDPGVSIFSLP